MDEERLIEAVRSYPSLWQVSAKCYKDAKAKENAWKKVATEVRCLCIKSKSQCNNSGTMDPLGRRRSFC